MDTTNSGTTEPRIPDRLLWFSADDWPDSNGTLAQAWPAARELRQREAWRRARESWGHAHGWDWTAFSLAATRQQHERRLAEQSERPGP